MFFSNKGVNIHFNCKRLTPYLIRQVQCMPWHNAKHNSMPYFNITPLYSWIWGIFEVSLHFWSPFLHIPSLFFDIFNIANRKVPIQLPYAALKLNLSLIWLLSIFLFFAINRQITLPATNQVVFTNHPIMGHNLTPISKEYKGMYF